MTSDIVFEINFEDPIKKYRDKNDSGNRCLTGYITTVRKFSAMMAGNSRFPAGTSLSRQVCSYADQPMDDTMQDCPGSW